MKLKKNGISAIYKRPKDRRLIINVIVVALTLVLTVVLTAALGNRLKDKAAELPTDTTPNVPSVSTVPGEDIHSAVPDTVTAFLSKSALSSKEALEEAIGSINGYDSVSLYVYSAEHGAAWASEAERLFAGTETDSALSATEIFGKLKEAGKYSSAVFDSRAFNAASSKAEANAISAYEQLLISELYSASCNEVIISGVVPTDQNKEDIKAYCSKLRELCPDIRLGIAVLRTGSVAEDLTYKYLSECFDFICLDLTSALTADLNITPDAFAPPKEGEDANAKDATAVFKNVKDTVEYELLHISRYGMRVLFKIPDGITAEECRTVLLPLLSGLSVHSVSLVSEF